MRALLIPLALLLAAAAAFLWFADGTVAPPAPPTGPVAQGPFVPAAETTGAVEADVPTTGSPAVREAAAARESDGNEAPPIPDDAVWIEVKVVDATSKEAAPDVDVWWTGNAQWERIQTLPSAEREELSRDPDRMARRFGWHARTDGKGLVRIAMQKDGGAQVFAQDEHRYARGWFQAQGEPPPEGHVLELQVDRTLLVHVVDAGGNDAAGVPIQLTPHDPDAGQRPMFWGQNGVRSDRRGIATFAHVQQMATWQFGPQNGKPVERFAIGVTTPGLDLEPMLVDAQALPEEPVELRLPPTGHLRVRLTFEQRPLAQLSHVSLNALRKPGPEETQMGFRPSRAWLRPVEDDGFATFAHVPLDVTFTATGQGAGICPGIPIEGPRATGLTVSTTIELSDRAAAIAGRICGRDGQPLAQQKVPAEYNFGRSSGGGEVETDRDGRFLWLAGGARGDKLPEIERLVFEQREKDATPLRCTVAPRPLTLGRNELGDLRLGVDALVVSGRFVFDGGVETDRQRHVGMQVERFEPGTREGGAHRWQPVQNLQQAQHEDHTFEVRGDVAPGRYRIAVHAWNHLPVDPVEFVPGQKDVEIPIRVGATLDVTCLLPEGVNAWQMQLRLVAEGGAPTTPDAPRVFAFWGDRLRGQPQGGSGIRQRFRWPAVEPGRYTLQVEPVLGMAPVLTVPDVVVPAPEGGDPRLAELDLRPVLQALRVRVHYPKGHQGSSAVIFPVPQPDADMWLGVSLHEREMVVPMPKGPLALMVASEGFRPVTLQGVQGELDVTMEAWPTVDLRFGVGAEIPEGVKLLAGVRRQGERERRRFRTEHQSGDLVDLLEVPLGSKPVVDGAATIPVGDGMRQLDVLVQVGRRGSGLKSIEPRDVFAGPPIDVRISLDEVREVAQKLREQAEKR